MGALFKIFTILTPAEMRKCFFIGVAMLFGAALEAVGIGAIMPLLSIIGQPDYLDQHQEFASRITFVGVTTHEQLVIGISWVLLGLYFFKNVYLFFLTKWQLHFSVQLQVEYARSLFAIYLQKPYLYHLNHNTATLLRRAYDGPQNIFILLFLSLLYFFTEILAAVAICMFLLWVNAIVSVVVICCFSGIVYGVSRFFRDRVQRQGETANRYSSLVFQWVNQGLGSIKETKILGREEFFYDMFDEAYQKFGHAHQQSRLTGAMPRFVIEGAVVAGLLLLIIGEIYVGQSPVEILPLLGLLAMAAFRLMPSANRILSYWNIIKFNMPLLDDLYEEMLLIRENRMSKTTLSMFSQPVAPMSFECEISINHLSFHYPEVEQEILKDVSFTIPKGSFVGIVGASGAGKTTFIDLFLGLLPPTEGQIFVDGVDIGNEIRAWQRNLAYVPQDIYLLDNSIRENIALGVMTDEIDDERIMQVLQMAELDKFIQTLPDGIYTVVGERGVKLSGGQRQRIGIARALYPQPKVLVLDEATSALDDETEKNITDTILKFKGELTIVAIAHRISTLAGCDFKIRFEDGQAIILKS